MLKLKGKFIITILLASLAAVIIAIFIISNRSIVQPYQEEGFSEQFSKYFNADEKSDINTNNTKSKVSLKYSTEGAYFFGMYSDNNVIQYLSVDICGEMGRRIHEYTFTPNSIVYSIVDINYAEPFYINPDNITIRNMNYKRYIICNGQMYDHTSDDVMQPVSIEFQEDVIADMLDYINTLNTDED